MSRRVKYDRKGLSYFYIYSYVSQKKKVIIENLPPGTDGRTSDNWHGED